MRHPLMLAGPSTYCGVSACPPSFPDCRTKLSLFLCDIGMFSVFKPVHHIIQDDNFAPF